MNRFSKAICGLTFSLAIAGCAGGQPPRETVVYTQPGVYDGYYDGYYGEYPGGYWAEDGYFYYRTNGNIYRRDEQSHFRREQFDGATGFKAVHRDRAHYDHNNRDYDYDHGRMRSGQGGANRYKY